MRATAVGPVEGAFAACAVRVEIGVGTVGFHGWGGGVGDGWVRRWEVTAVATVGRELGVFASWVDVHGVAGGEGSWWGGVVGFGFGSGA